MAKIVSIVPIIVPTVIKRKFIDTIPINQANNVGKKKIINAKPANIPTTKFNNNMIKPVSIETNQ